mmetsp:Transcript_44581/g.45079  ORF Transcript_44581/g.45079 Transcript_44581/m.45079 type:complete len:126 (-) Transcript_44581:177-554(-)
MGVHSLGDRFFDVFAICYCTTIQMNCRCDDRCYHVIAHVFSMKMDKRNMPRGRFLPLPPSLSFQIISQMKRSKMITNIPMTSRTKTHIEVYFRKVTVEQQTYMPDFLNTFVYHNTHLFFLCPFSG